MRSRRPLLVTLALVVAGAASQQLPAQADVAPAASQTAASTSDKVLVPRLVRSARLEAPLQKACDWSPSAALSADGHTAVLACKVVGGTSSVAVLSDAFPGGAWRVTARIDGPHNVWTALAADGRTLALHDAYAGESSIYSRVGGTWRRTATLGRPSLQWVSTSFGLSGDGNTLAVGSGRVGGGRVQIFQRTSTGWSQQGIIGPSLASDAHFYPHALALSASGDTVVIGAHYAHGDITRGVGAAFVYQRSGADWQLAKTVTGPADRWLFGRAITVSADGGTAAVHAGNEVWVFRVRGANGKADVARVATFPAPTVYGSSQIALSANGHTLVVGNPLRTLRGVLYGGRAYRFVHTDGGWRFGGVLESGAGDTWYGVGVAVDASGRRVLVAGYPAGSRSAKGLVADLYQRPAA